VAGLFLYPKLDSAIVATKAICVNQILYAYLNIRQAREEDELSALFPDAST
jgi:hypothetical protein